MFGDWSTPLDNAEACPVTMLKLNGKSYVMQWQLPALRSSHGNIDQAVAVMADRPDAGDMNPEERDMVLTPKLPLNRTDTLGFISPSINTCWTRAAGLALAMEVFARSNFIQMWTDTSSLNRRLANSISQRSSSGRSTPAHGDPLLTAMLQL
ncbi:hypothetical protein VC83_07647 [Pseudogymnoascus destructans]|uniref:Uncharacterized protein n=1 Tax=Pseudogymnoascus destructans TaxID=655981 RepID=A0A177A062_9PEZI|nr:uncharacterized protein VC83_07647 [Pseudogymnoascus destructans]OAF55566.1 hypothetical protein VC83_07647 [Pseudogymnoascus destructans]